MVQNKVMTSQGPGTSLLFATMPGEQLMTKQKQKSLQQKWWNLKNLFIKLQPVARNQAHYCDRLERIILDHNSFVNYHILVS